MNTATMSDLRANMKEYFDEIEENEDILIVPRPGKKEGIVIMSISEYRSMTETEYLLSNEANREMLMQAKKELENGDTVEFAPE